MANEEQLSILKQGAKVWNEWRAENQNIYVDFSNAEVGLVDLSYAKLFGADFSQAILIGTEFSFADLVYANLSGTDLRGASLIGADLRGANLEKAILQVAHFDRANLSEAKLNEANLEQSYFGGANLSGSNLQGANLSRVNLGGTNFNSAQLIGSIFSEAFLGGTIFGNSDMSKAIGLASISHHGPSHISIDTFALSKGKIPETFLQGCGLSNAEINYAKLYDPELSNEEINKILYKIYDLRATQALQVSPLFISYSHADGVFVDKLESQLNAKGIRFWRDIHDMKAGRIETQIDRAISQNRTVLLILSEHSIKSDWVEHEVRTARGLEKDMGRDVLCPIALDDSWKSSPWPKRVMEQIMEYNILDFSAWEDDAKFGNTFNKLIDGLGLFYKDKSHGE